MSEPIPELRRRQALQERVAAAIVEAAAQVLAQQGEQVSMTDVANAAGVARATVYRYFPSREALLTQVADIAVADAAERLASARIAEGPPEEGVTRAVRALADVGEPFIVLARERVRPNRRQFDDEVAAPLRQLFERGQEHRAIRSDISAAWLAEAFIAVIANVLAATPKLGREDTTAAITSLVLDGARAREPDSRR